MKKTSTWFVLVMIVLVGTLLVACSGKEQSEKAVKEEQTEMDVKSEDTEGKNSKVVTIGDRTFDDDDLLFYTLMNKVKVELQKADAEDEEHRTYYEEQFTYYDNVNVNLQSLIELYGMSLLAEEKKYFIPEDKLYDEVSAFNKMIEKNEAVETLIEEFGREKYNRLIEEYMRQTMLRDRVAKELEEELQEENPEAQEEEINYLLEEEFEELYMAQVSTLDMEIHLK